jgi:hypothetical protein
VPPVAVPVGDPLPLAGVGAAALDRAAEHYAQGDLAAALAALDEIAVADPLRRDADVLRGAVQRSLLGLADAERLEGGAP